MGVIEKHVFKRTIVTSLVTTPLLIVAAGPRVLVKGHQPLRTEVEMTSQFFYNKFFLSLCCFSGVL